MAQTITPEQLLQDAAWLRRLAARLADDRDDADDLAQEAWIAAWRRQPDPDRPLRPWLAKVVRDAARMRRRADARRRGREQIDAGDAASSTPEDLLAQARLHQVLVELVLELDEPYRATVLARYVEGRTAAEIARSTNVPEGTVRWRLREALTRLRDRLDARTERRAWLPWLVATRSPSASNAAATTVAIGLGVLMILLVALSPGRGLAPRLGSPVAPPSGVAATDARAVAERATSPPVPWLEPASTTTRTIAGRVIGDDGAPIAGAVVQLQTWPTGSEEARQTTGGDGRFTFEPRWATRYVVVGSATDRAAASIDVDPRVSRGASERDDVVLILSDCTQGIEGSVTDAGGGPIVGAAVQRLSAGLRGPFGATLTTGADGRYATCVPRGTSWFDIGADGYEHVVRQIDARDGWLRVDVALAPAASVTGTVTDARDDAPIAGAWIALTPLQRRSGEAGDRQAISQADGTFIVDGLAAGRYMLTARNGYHVTTVIDEIDVIAARGSRPVVVRMRPGVVVGGVVRAASRPITGAPVELAVPDSRRTNPSVDPLPVVTGPDGTFAVRGVPPATHAVPHVSGYTVRSPASIDTTSSRTDVAIEVTAAPALRGRVVRDGIAVADAEVTARAADRSQRTARTGVDGRFELTDLSPGEFRVFARSERVGAFATRATVVVVPANQVITLDLDGGSMITGTVRDQDGAPVVGAQVVAKERDSDDYGAATTTTTGSYAIAELAGGAYSLFVRPYAGAPGALPWIDDDPGLITVERGHARVGPVALAVRRVERPIEGRVVDEAGAAVADAIVRLGPVGGWLTGVPMTRTDVAGRFRLVAIGDGPFAVDAGVGGGPLAVATTVAPGTTDLVLRLVRPGAIDGSLVDLADARVWLRRTGGIDGAASVPGNSRTIVTDGNRFRFDDLVPGEYTLLAIGADTTATSRVRVEPGTTATIALAAEGTRSLAGTVTRFGTDEPVPEATCVAVPAIGDVRPAGVDASLPHAARTAADGSFTLASAPAGEALVLCFPPRRYSVGAARVASATDARIEVVSLPPQQPAHVGFDLDSLVVPAVVGTVFGVEARAAGVLAGDRVVAIDGTDVSSLYHEGVYWLLNIQPVGTRLRVTFDRAGRSYERTLTVVDAVPW